MPAAASAPSHSCTKMQQTLLRLGRCRYAQSVLRQLGPVDALIPPLPSLVRYKEAIAVKAEAAKGGQTSPAWCGQPASILTARRLA